MALPHPFAWLAAFDRLFGDLRPLLWREVDDRGIALAPARLARAGDIGAKFTPDHGDEQLRAQRVGDKTRKYKENPTEHRAETRTFEMNRANPLLAERRAEAIEVAAPRSPQDQKAQNRRGDKKARGP